MWVEIDLGYNVVERGFEYDEVVKQAVNNKPSESAGFGFGTRDHQLLYPMEELEQAVRTYVKLRTMLNMPEEYVEIRFTWSNSWEQAVICGIEDALDDDPNFMKDN